MDIHACDDACDDACDNVCDDVCDDVCDGDGDVCVVVSELNVCVFAHSDAAVFKNTRGGSIM